MGSDHTTQVLSASASMPVGAMLLAMAVLCPDSHLSYTVQGSQFDLFFQIAILKNVSRHCQTLARVWSG